MRRMTWRRPGTLMHTLRSRSRSRPPAEAAGVLDVPKAIGSGEAQSRHRTCVGFTHTGGILKKFEEEGDMLLSTAQHPHLETPLQMAYVMTSRILAKLPGFGDLAILPGILAQHASHGSLSSQVADPFPVAANFPRPYGGLCEMKRRSSLSLALRSVLRYSFKELSLVSRSVIGHDWDDSCWRSSGRKTTYGPAAVAAPELRATVL